MLLALEITTWAMPTRYGAQVGLGDGVSQHSGESYWSTLLPGIVVRAHGPPPPMPFCSSRAPAWPVRSLVSSAPDLSKIPSINPSVFVDPALNCSRYDASFSRTSHNFCLATVCSRKGRRRPLCVPNLERQVTHVARRASGALEAKA